MNAAAWDAQAEVIEAAERIHSALLFRGGSPALGDVGGFVGKEHDGLALCTCTLAASWRLLMEEGGRDLVLARRRRERRGRAARKAGR